MKKRKKSAGKKIQKRKVKTAQISTRSIVWMVVIVLLFCILLGVYYYIDKNYTIQNVYVEGNSHYTDQEIIEKVMTGKLGHNSLYLNFKYRNQKIEDIPFVSALEVNIVTPDTVRITIYEKSLAGYVTYLGRYMYFDKEGTVVESSTVKTDGVPEVVGLSFDHVVMYEMLTGRTPYDGDTPVSVAIQHINGGARRPSELMAGIPLGLEQITMHAMTASADDRYANAADMLRDMEEFRKNPSITFRFGAAAAASGAAGNSAAAAGRQNAQRSGMTRSEAERYAAARNAKNPGGRTPEERRAERARREAEAAAEKRRKTLTIAIIVAAAVLAILVVIAILAGVGAFGGSDREPMETVQEGNVRVPNFVGMDLDDIDPDDYPDLVVDIRNVKEDFSDEYEEGLIMEQSPKAREEVKIGRTVTLTVSKGAEEKKMPDLKNVKEADAIKQLEELKLGLKITIKDESNSEIEQGKVIRTEPSADSKLKKEQEVTLYVSLGENKMPDLRNDTKNNAESRLKALELSLKITFLEEENDEVEKDRVIRTEPAAGSQLNKDDRVTIYISTGSGKIPMPDLIGMSETQATKKLEDLKLSFRIQEVYDPVVPEGYVVSQSVKPGDMVSKDSAYITIDISKGVDPATTTPPTEAPTTPPATDPPTDPPTENP